MAAFPADILLGQYKGFDPAAEPGADHHGLRNLRARAAEEGGTLTLESTRGAGTTLRVALPLGAAP